MDATENLYLLGIVLLFIHSVCSQNWNFEGNNVALKKYAIDDPPGHHGPATRAVDNNTSHQWSSNSCSHTAGRHRGEASWTVFLDGYYIIKGVKLFNRIYLEERLKDFKVIGGPPSTTLYDDESASTQLYDQLVIEIPINSKTPHSVITILLPERPSSETILTLCEVQVFAITNGCVDVKQDYLRRTIREGNYNSTYGLVSVGSILDFTCIDTGYKLSHHSSITCKSDGNYSMNIPSCIEILCSIPDKIQHGNYLNDSNISYKFHDEIIYKCDYGYTPIQPQIRYCVDISTWNGTDPTCTLITCPYPINFMDGTLIHERDAVGNAFPFETELEIICDEGFVTKENTTQCQVDGKWSIIPSCTLIVCESLSDPHGGIYTYNKKPADNNKYAYYYGTIANINCLDGFDTIGGENTTTLTCGNEGVWMGNMSICVRSEPIQAANPVLPGAIGGGVAGVSLLALITVLAVILRKRRRNESQNTMKREEFDQCIQSTYENSTIGGSGNHIQDTSNGNDQYYNFNEIRRIPKTAIQVSDIADIVLSFDTYKDGFTSQFKSLPDGLKKSCNSASNAKGKNRYRNLYAYDETRVVLDVWNKKTDTDYINACFVHGFNRPKAFIASQGPTKATLDDFWRMVWQNKCEKIIMLTQLHERGKMKSERYWPEDGSQIYGTLTVTMVRADQFSNFVIRTLNLSKEGEESRVITQFHFTSWPDKDVPLFCSSLVHFHHKVKEEVKPNEAPMVVHCSAGIGRTGTFIALDYLYDQANELGYVDVLGCVESLRQQRVNMVQTKSQYIYIHIALAEIFSLKTSLVTTTSFKEHYTRMLSKDKEKMNRRQFDIEFELLNKLSMFKDAIPSEQTEVTTKVEDYMPSISQPGLHLFGEYIDAVFLPMYREEHALIITQSPIEATTEDFWKLIYHQNVHTIVMMNNTIGLTDKQIYWPKPGNDLKIGEMTIKYSSTMMKNAHTIVSLNIVKDDKETNVSLIQFGGWCDGKSTPDTTESCLSALELVEDNQRLTGNNPVLVHCTDGIEKSGLFCVIVSLLDRTKVEQDVAISQVIQEIRSRRPGVIPNVVRFEGLVQN